MERFNGRRGDLNIEPVSEFIKLISLNESFLKNTADSLRNKLLQGPAYDPYIPSSRKRQRAVLDQVFERFPSVKCGRWPSGKISTSGSENSRFETRPHRVCEPSARCPTSWDKRPGLVRKFGAGDRSRHLTAVQNYEGCAKNSPFICLKTRC
ncbi:hypothetical protein AVEN_56372-1 [Araneus ventricosus]|uniref:Uncharacterized protein n=1 Tax=Araneus ventricosus TaxID=182803 RepID=A0A4Y2QWH7_ARAVE|nr:hypothetical protein AVEN_56372-1 [Araneus ventricosus]